jgi:hypothetical protein
MIKLEVHQTGFFYISQVNLNDGGMGSMFGQEFSNWINGVSIDRYANDK